jgi:hypothetical protein
MPVPTPAEFLLDKLLPPAKSDLLGFGYASGPTAKRCFHIMNTSQVADMLHEGMLEPRPFQPTLRRLTSAVFKQLLRNARSVSDDFCRNAGAGREFRATAAA